IRIETTANGDMKRFSRPEVRSRTGLKTGKANFGQHRFQRFKRQADHIGIAAFDVRYRVETFMLDGIAAGLVKWIAAGDISLDFGVAVVAHDHARFSRSEER